MIIKINNNEEYKFKLPQEEESVNAEQVYSLIDRLSRIAKMLLKDPLSQVSVDLETQSSTRTYTKRNHSALPKFENKEQLIPFIKDYYANSKDDFTKMKGVDKNIVGNRIAYLRAKYKLLPQDIGFTRWPNIQEAKSRVYTNILIQ